MRRQRERRKARSIFISYSREGGQAEAVSLFQSLVQVLGEKAVFLDVGREAMEAGKPWKESVREALGGCDTLLLVLDPEMAARLRDPESAVLFEVETALRNGATIACVRVNGAQVPIASELPPLLGQLPEWHSPEIHSDAVVADIERVVKELTGRVPGEIPFLDRRDLTVLGVLGGLGVVAWLSVGRNLLNLGETWLWSAVLVLPWLLWMAGRRALSIGSRGRATVSYRQAASWLAVLMVLGGGCFVAARGMYRRPVFVGDGGILVSRIAGDPSDRRQSELVLRLGKDERTDVESRVAPLPRRIGFNFAINLSDGDETARHYGSEAEAAAVLWGNVLAPTETRLAVSLTFIEGEAVFARRGLKFVGVMEARNLKGLEGDLGYLAETLPKLFTGYRLYRTAKTGSDLEAAESEFSRALEIVEQGAAAGPNDREALDQIMASLRFFRANTRVFLDRKDDARTDYEKAIALTADIDGSPRYLEAASNLAWLLKDAARLEEAVAILRTVDLRCRIADEPACTYASYNLGDTLSDQGNHEEAATQFRTAIARLEQAGLGSEDPRLEAKAHQYLAYSLVRLAQASDPGGQDSLLDEAQKESERAEALLEEAGVEVPEYYRITGARIQIERREFQLAIDELSTLKVDLQWQASVHALLAGAYACTKNVDELQKHLGAILGAVQSCPADEPSRISIGEGIREYGRIQEMCAENMGA